MRKLSKEDLDKINRKIRRDEHTEIAPLLVTKIKKSKKVYNRKNNKFKDEE